MIPTTSGNSAGGPAGEGTILFHVVVNDFARTYSLDGPETNAMRLHLEVMQAARNHERKLREIDLRANSKDAALALMQEHFPEYSHSGTWKQ
jgi:hypothetical protein